MQKVGRGLWQARRVGDQLMQSGSDNRFGRERVGLLSQRLQDLWERSDVARKIVQGCTNKVYWFITFVVCAAMCSFDWGCSFTTPNKVEMTLTSVEETGWTLNKATSALRPSVAYPCITDYGYRLIRHMLSLLWVTVTQLIESGRHVALRHRTPATNYSTAV
ncbi:hypothetical protein J6590_007363 [Homalodisca vitripennis]|nr:hypothetical protein J6590_007363 [Homalodisca vitripennis]